jgi:hypothetical protein
MTEPATAARLAGIHDAIAEELPSGGFLRCNTCHRREDVGDVAANLLYGWPRCCRGHTMTWWTPRQIAAGEAPND